MSKRVWGLSLLGVFALLAISGVELAAQLPRSRTPAPSPKATDLMIRYRMSTMGQNMETTTMLKGSRERTETKSGHGVDIINLTQCDLKRTIQMSDTTRKYVITPMETVDATANSGASARVASEPARRGGVITYNTTVVDTGERKEMFGFQARHIKTTISIESSPDACSPIQQRMEMDGWYIDLAFGLSCDIGAAQMGGIYSASGGCRDRVSFNRKGGGRTGYALSETTTMYGPDGSIAFTSSREVVDLSREPLDAALFDVPAGYLETKNAQELYGRPSVAAMMAQANSGGQSPADGRIEIRDATAKAPGAIRVGVVRVNNRTDRAVSLESLTERLIGEIQGNGIEAVRLNAISPNDAATEAKTKQCDFILYTDVVALKISAAKKIGGMFGRAAGVGGIDKTEAKVEYQLFASGETSPRLKSAASAKEEGDDASAAKALEQESRMVSAEAGKKDRN